MKQVCRGDEIQVEKEKAFDDEPSEKEMEVDVQKGDVYKVNEQDEVTQKPITGGIVKLCQTLSIG